MTKKEQVLAVLNGERPDEMPCGFWLHFPAGNEYGQAAVDTHLKFFQESGTSLCKIMNENTDSETDRDPTVPLISIG